MRIKILPIVLLSILCVGIATPVYGSTITARPEPQPNGVLILTDDFNDPETSAFAAYGDEWMTWSVAGGIGTLASASNGDEIAVQYAEPIVADAAIEVDLRIGKAEVEGVGVIWRSVDLRSVEELDWHYYHVGIRPREKIIEFAMLSEDMADVEALASCQLAPSLSRISEFRRLRVEALGAQVRAFIDGVFVCEWSDETISEPGLIGLYLGVPDELSSKATSAADFANLRVYALSGDEASAAPEDEEATGPALTKGSFEDDFSTFDRGWWTGEDENGDARYENGALVLRNLTSAEYRTESSPLIDAQDVVIDVEATLLSGTEDNWQTVFCRQSETSGYAANFSADGYYGATMRDGDAVVTLEEPTATDAVHQGVGETNQAQLVCVGRRLQFWINGELLIDRQIDPEAGGVFGLAVSALDGEYSEVAFDNFKAVLPDAGSTGVSDGEEDATPSIEAVVSAPTLNVRAGAGASFARVGTVRVGDRLPVLEANAACTWIKVVTPTTIGWVNADYVTLSGPCNQAGGEAAAGNQADEPVPTDEPAAAVEPTSGDTIIADFEEFGWWRRGDETWGDFRQSADEVYNGVKAGKLTYDFPANVPGDRNYVVFLHSAPIAGEPKALQLQVYGDGSGSILNTWVKDADGQVWQFTFGPVTHTGWKTMSAPLDPSLEWPVQPIGGSATRFVYPVSFDALVLDYPTNDAARGVIYVDDLAAVYGD